MYATLFKPRILVPSFPKLDMPSSIQVSSKLVILTRYFLPSPIV